MLQFDFKNDSLNKLAEAVGKSGRSLTREFATAVNKTSKGLKTPASKEIRTELAAPAKAVNKSLSQTRKATSSSLMAVFTVAKSNRIPLRDFGARQTKKGVSYRISKSTGRRTADSAFQVNKLGNHVFKRVGKQRLPIRKLKGPSPHGVFVAKEMDKPVTADAEVRLQKEIERRIQYNIFKANQLA